MLIISKFSTPYYQQCEQAAAGNVTTEAEMGQCRPLCLNEAAWSRIAVICHK